jgi:tRNA A-37 threonylcarbamoyl transferase component Bud32
VRLIFASLALVIDAALWIGLRDRAAINQAALDAFVAINVPLIALLVAITLAMLRWPAARKMSLLNAAIVVEAFTVIVWVQLTGTLTTYFVLVGALFVLWYRLYLGYLSAAICAGSLLAFHTGAVALELYGVLRPESLFTGELSSAYTVPVYQAIVIWSMVWIYWIMFLGANVVMNKLREKDRALAEVRNEVMRVAEEVKHGRLTGTVVDDEYALGELLGRGGMGEIYLARRISDDTNVAVKVLHGHLITHDTMLERFRREAGLAGRVPSRHTARILGVGTDRELHTHYIAMEYLRGEDLGAFLRRRGTLSPDELVPIARAIAAALDAAHAVGVIHRDLKPQNVFLVRTGDSAERAFDVRLLDFGMSKLVDNPDSQDTQLTQVNAVLGTIGYMAPEQALGRVADVGAAADVFSFAAIVYRALTGRLPFQAGDVLGAIREVAHVQPPAPSSLAPGLHPHVDAVIAIGLAKAIADRYASASVFVDDLEAASRGKLREESLARADSIHSGVGGAATLTAEA